MLRTSSFCVVIRLGRGLVEAREFTGGRRLSWIAAAATALPPADDRSQADRRKLQLLARALLYRLALTMNDES